MGSWLDVGQGIAQSGGTNIASSIINGVGAYFQGKQNVKNSKELMDYQQKINLENWNLQNERQDQLLANQYINQVNSARSAGISPFWSEGAQSAPVAGNVGSPSATSGQQWQGQAIDPLTAAQIANINADTADKNADANRKRAEQPYVGAIIASDISLKNSQALLNDRLRSIKDTEEKKLLQEIDSIFASILRDNALADSQMGVNKSVIDYNVIKGAVDKGLYDIEVAKLPAILQNFAANTYAAYEQGKASQAQAQQALAAIDTLNAQAEMYRHQADLFTEQGKTEAALRSAKKFQAMTQGFKALQEGKSIKSHTDTYNVLPPWVHSLYDNLQQFSESYKGFTGAGASGLGAAGVLMRSIP